MNSRIMRITPQRFIMKHSGILLFIFLFCSALQAQDCEVRSPYIKTLMARVNDEWDRLPVLSPEKGEVLSIRFDELSHEYRRYAYSIKHCNADWTDSLDAGLDKAFAAVQDGEVLCIVGSLYIQGDVRRYLRKNYRQE